MRQIEKQKDSDDGATTNPRAVPPSPELPVAGSLRILLWDIDGTLMRSTHVGGYKVYTIPVLEEIFGTAGRLADLHVSGMTDLQIIFEALNDSGISLEHI